MNSISTQLSYTQRKVTAKTPSVSNGSIAPVAKTQLTAGNGLASIFTANNLGGEATLSLVCLLSSTTYSPYVSEHTLLTSIGTFVISGVPYQRLSIFYRVIPAGSSDTNVAFGIASNFYVAQGDYIYGKKMLVRNFNTNTPIISYATSSNTTSSSTYVYFNTPGVVKLQDYFHLSFLLATPDTNTTTTLGSYLPSATTVFSHSTSELNWRRNIACVSRNISSSTSVSSIRATTSTTMGSYHSIGLAVIGTPTFG